MRLQRVQGLREGHPAPASARALKTWGSVVVSTTLPSQAAVRHRLKGLDWSAGLGHLPTVLHEDHVGPVRTLTFSIREQPGAGRRDDRQRVKGRASACDTSTSTNEPSEQSVHRLRHPGQPDGVAVEGGWRPPDCRWWVRSPPRRSARFRPAGGGPAPEPAPAPPCGSVALRCLIEKRGPWSPLPPGSIPRRPRCRDGSHYGPPGTRSSGRDPPPGARRPRRVRPVRAQGLSPFTTRPLAAGIAGKARDEEEVAGAKWVDVLGRPHADPGPGGATPRASG